MQRIRILSTVSLDVMMALHLNLGFIVDSQLLAVVGRDVLQPGPGYLAGHQLLHGEPTSRVLGYYNIITMTMTLHYNVNDITLHYRLLLKP